LYVSTVTHFEGDVHVNGGDLVLGSGSATTTLTSAAGMLGLGSSTPGALFSIQGDTNVALYVAGLSVGTADVVRVSTSTASATTTAFVITSNGRVGIGTTTPSRDLSVTGNIQVSGGNNATSTIDTGLNLGIKGGNLGVGTTSPRSTLGVVGDALLSSTGTTTLSLTSSGSGVGSCIEMRAASSSDIYRIYISRGVSTGNGPASTTPLVIEVGSCK